MRRVEVTEVGVDLVACAEKTKEWTGWSHSSSTALAMLPICRMLVVLRSPASITGTLSASCCAAKAVSFWKSAAACSGWGEGEKRVRDRAGSPRDCAQRRAHVAMHSMFVSPAWRA